MKSPSLLLLASICISTSFFAQTVWHPVESGTSQDLRCIDFANDLVGYAAGDQTLLKTTDGGANWQEIEIDSISANDNQDWYGYDIQFFTELHGRMVLGQWGGIVETIDGGLNWTHMTPASSGFCQFGSFYFFDADHGLAGGAGCFEGTIIDMLENGVWSSTAHPQGWFVEDLVTNFDFYDAQLGMASAAYGTLLRTTDGGSTWDTIPNPETTSVFTDVAFLSEETVYATYARQGGFGILKSLDGGLTWDTDWETATFFYPSMFAVHIDGLGRPYLGGLNGNDQTTGVIFDKGPDFWSYQALDFRIMDIDSHSDSITFLVGDSGAIYVNVDPLLLGLADLDTGISLHVYPNPASDFINISVNARAHEVMDVRLFDMQGKEIDIEYISTDYGIPVKVSHIPIGEYLIEVRTSKGRNVIVFQKD